MMIFRKVTNYKQSMFKFTMFIIYFLFSKLLQENSISIKEHNTYLNNNFVYFWRCFVESGFLILVASPFFLLG